MNCQQTLIAQATDYFLSLRRQGLGKMRAMDHAVQRFGVTYGSIIRELDRRSLRTERSDLTVAA